MSFLMRSASIDKDTRGISLPLEHCPRRLMPPGNRSRDPRTGEVIEDAHCMTPAEIEAGPSKAALAAINDHAEHDHNRAPHGRK